MKKEAGGKEWSGRGKKCKRMNDIGKEVKRKQTKADDNKGERKRRNEHLP